MAYVRKAKRSGRDTTDWVKSHGRCQHCGKVRYASRADAKRKIKQLPASHREGHVAPYPCPDDPAWYHLGHLPNIVRQGESGRPDIPTRKRDPR